MQRSDETDDHVNRLTEPKSTVSYELYLCGEECVHSNTRASCVRYTAQMQ